MEDVRDEGRKTCLLSSTVSGNRRVRGSVKNYVVSALIGSVPILVANWSRTLWPRLAVTVALVAVQLITGSIFILTSRAI